MIHLTRKIDYACPRCGEKRLEACSVLCLSNTFAIGGLLGHIGNAAHTTGTGCAVNCTLTSAASTEIGMVIGAFNGKTKAIVLSPALYDTGFHTIHTVYGE